DYYCSLYMGGGISVF
nr:immunoglobulin light chain junction region [Macaca mulatta]MOY05625.1 immunoglobulin light chain junction region [Macaca mulatta]MOY06954.1 immunoglobulin light chain junction region [Macaca mulatta]MOY08214.1 immunoglobulin light chain junction region [Macaca mulatta]MOY08445.1 immunoglobulin light chain junction region [Macaca mulatta]